MDAHLEKHPFNKFSHVPMFLFLMLKLMTNFGPIDKELIEMFHSI